MASINKIKIETDFLKKIWIGIIIQKESNIKDDGLTNFTSTYIAIRHMLDDLYCKPCPIKTNRQGSDISLI
jgi:hypothetical protein